MSKKILICVLFLLLTAGCTNLSHQYSDHEVLTQPLPRSSDKRDIRIPMRKLDLMFDSYGKRAVKVRVVCDRLGYSNEAEKALLDQTFDAFKKEEKKVKESNYVLPFQPAYPPLPGE